MKTIFGAAGLIWFFGMSDCVAAEADAVPGAVRIRIANVSDVPFSEVVIGFPGRGEDYGALDPGRASEYRSVALAFANPGYRIVADGKPYRAISVDNLGDTRLEEGSYTLTIDVYGGVLVFGLMIDED